MGTRGPRWLAGVWGQRMPPGPGECSPHLAHRASSGGCHDRLPRSCESWGSSSGWQRGGCRQSLSAPTSSKSSACSAFRRLGLCQMTMYEPVFTRRVLLHAEEVAIANAERGSTSPSMPIRSPAARAWPGVKRGCKLTPLTSQYLPARSLSQTAIMMRNRPVAQHWREPAAPSRRLGVAFLALGPSRAQTWRVRGPLSMISGAAVKAARSSMRGGHLVRASQSHAHDRLRARTLVVGSQKKPSTWVSSTVTGTRAVAHSARTVLGSRR